MLRKALIFFLLSTSTFAHGANPFQLAYLAYWGYFKDAGVGSYQMLCHQITRDGVSVIASAVIGNAINQNRVDIDELGPRFQNSVEFQLEGICRNS